MIGHSVLQEGIGTCHHYVIGTLLKVSWSTDTLADVGAQTAASVTKVSWNNIPNSDIDHILA